jgi:hypothetical protein
MNRHEVPPILGSNCSSYCSSPSNSRAASARHGTRERLIAKSAVEHAGNSENYCPAPGSLRERPAGQHVTSRSYNRNIANRTRMRVTGDGGEPPGLPDRPAGQGFSEFRRRKATKATRPALPLIADGPLTIVEVAALLFGLFPLEGGKTSIVSIQTLLVQREGKSPVNSCPLGGRRITPTGKEGVSRKLRNGRRFSEFTTTIVRGRTLSIRLAGKRGVRTNWVDNGVHLWYESFHSGT